MQSLDEAADSGSFLKKKAPPPAVPSRPAHTLSVATRDVDADNLPQPQHLIDESRNDKFVSPAPTALQAAVAASKSATTVAPAPASSKTTTTGASTPAEGQRREVKKPKLTGIKTTRDAALDDTQIELHFFFFCR